MESHKNNFEYYGSHKKRKKPSKKVLVFLGFMFVIGIIVSSILYSNASITGRVVSSFNSNNSIAFSSELTIPDLNFKGEYPEIKILSRAETTIYIGKKSFSLDGSKENRIVLKDFSGRIEFDEDGILFNGQVSDINLNNLPIQEKDNKKIKVYVHSKIPYNSVEFREDLFLKEINYISSGTLFLCDKNRDKITLNREPFFISNYFGELKIYRNTLFLDGFAKDLEISGDGKRISISN
jgi:hypothetical protein